MFNYQLLILVSFILSITACKPKQKVVAPTVDTEQAVAKANTLGKVSHQYRATGCATVILVLSPNNPSVLIPKDKLAANLDVDGLEIYFNYHTLRMPQPAGCTSGVPAVLQDITKK